MSKSKASKASKTNEKREAAMVAASQRDQVAKVAAPKVRPKLSELPGTSRHFLAQYRCDQVEIQISMGPDEQHYAEVILHGMGKEGLDVSYSCTFKLGQFMGFLRTCGIGMKRWAADQVNKCSTEAAVIEKLDKSFAKAVEGKAGIGSGRTSDPVQQLALHLLGLRIKALEDAEHPNLKGKAKTKHYEERFAKAKLNEKAMLHFRKEAAAKLAELESTDLSI